MNGTLSHLCAYIGKTGPGEPLGNIEIYLKYECSPVKILDLNMKGKGSRTHSIPNTGRIVTEERDYWESFISLAITSWVNIPCSTTRWHNGCLMLGQRRRRWSNIETTFGSVYRADLYTVTQWNNVWLMLVYRLRRLPNIKQTLIGLVVWAGITASCPHSLKQGQGRRADSSS